MAINAGTMTMRAAEKLVELAGLVEFRMILPALPKRPMLILRVDRKQIMQALRSEPVLSRGPFLTVSVLRNEGRVAE